MQARASQDQERRERRCSSEQRKVSLSAAAALKCDRGASLELAPIMSTAVYAVPSFSTSNILICAKRSVSCFDLIQILLLIMTNGMSYILIGWLRLFVRQRLLRRIPCVGGILRWRSRGLPASFNRCGRYSANESYCFPVTLTSHRLDLRIRKVY